MMVVCACQRLCMRGGTAIHGICVVYDRHGVDNLNDAYPIEETILR